MTARPAIHSLIFCDIDGCLSFGKNVPMDLPRLAAMRALLPELAKAGIGFTLSTGRPQPYAEAMAQVLGVDLPFVCEGGAMVYVPETDAYLAMAGDEGMAAIHALRRAIENSGIIGDQVFFEIGKAYSLCLTGPAISGRGHAVIRGIMEDFKARYADYPVVWTHSTTSVDITPMGTNKGSGLRAVCDMLGVDQANSIAIGDSNNDMSMLTIAGRACCPANASDEVKAVAQTVANQDYADGVLAILRDILASA